jgi:hypothetical protein
MQRTILYSTIFFACVGLNACHSEKHSKTKKKLPGIWQATPITIDGNNNDWPQPYPEYDSKASLGYAVSNDKENLYITCETGDQATQLKILRNGLTVWIDKTGEKEEVTAINFPIPRSFNRGVGAKAADDADRPSPGHWGQGQQTNGQQRANMEDRIRKMMDGANEYSLQGFRACNTQFPILEKDSCGIIVRIGLDETNELVWEAVIPFKTFYKPQISKTDKGKPMTVCFQTTGVDRPAGGGNRGGNGGGMRPGGMRIGMGGMGMGMGMGGGMGRGMGRGGGGGNGGGQSNAMESLYKSTDTWKKFGIAWQE